MRIGVKGRLALYLVVFSTLLVGGVLLTVQGWQDRPLVRPVSHGLTAVGHVVDYKTSLYKGASYAAVVQYETADVQVVRFTAPSTVHRPHIGASAEVSYQMLQPFQAHDLSVPGWTWQWEFSAGLALVAMMLTMGGLAVYLTAQVRRTKMEPTDPRPAHTITHAAVAMRRSASVLPLVLVPFLAALVFYDAYSRTPTTTRRQHASADSPQPSSNEPSPTRSSVDSRGPLDRSNGCCGAHDAIDEASTTETALASG